MCVDLYFGLAGYLLDMSSFTEIYSGNSRIVLFPLCMNLTTIFL